MMYVIDILLEILDIYIVYQLMHVFFKEPMVERRVEIACFILRDMLTLLVFEMASFPLLNMLVSIVGMFGLTWCYQSTLSKRIATTFLVYGIGFIAEAIVAIFVEIESFHMLVEVPEADTIVLFMVEVLQWLMILFLRKYRHTEANVHVPQYLLFGIVSMQIVFVVMISLIVQQDYADRRIAVVSLGCVILSDMILIYFYDSFAKTLNTEIRLKLSEQEKESYHNEVRLMKDSQEELFRFRHDINNRLSGVASLLRQKKLEEAEEYISKLVKLLEKTENYVQSENLVVDSILNYKLSQATEQGIQVSVDVELPQQLQIEDDDIIVVFGNLLDNAIEAANFVKDEKRISVYAKYDKGNLFIDVVNTYVNKVKERDGNLVTGKKDKEKHGIGLQSVDAVVEKYHGEKDIFYDGKEFQVTIIMCEKM